MHSPGEQGYIAFSPGLDISGISSEQAFVYDVNADKIIYEKGEKKVVYPASTTKLLTALYALSVLSPDMLVTPGNELELVSPTSSIAYIRTYHTLSVEMLVEGMMLPSGNDAAYALAAAAGRYLSGDENISGKDAVSFFMDSLNGYAKTIGLCGTHFTVPDGLAGTEHYSTLEDMLIISKLASENPVISKYGSLVSDDVVYASGHINTWVNTNLMLHSDSEYYSKYVTGLKTGSANGRYSLIVTAENNGQKYIAGVFGAKSDDDRFSDMLKIVNSLFS